MFPVRCVTYLPGLYLIIGLTCRSTSRGAFLAFGSVGNSLVNGSVGQTSGSCHNNENARAHALLRWITR